MITPVKPVTIVIADDDVDDCLLLREALEENGLVSGIHFVGDGEELLEYLRREGRHAESNTVPCPLLILLDLNMPRMDGREALADIKSDPRLRHIPVIVLTTSATDEDISHTYALGANSFIVKPATFAALVQVMNRVIQYWLTTVQLPPHPKNVSLL